MKVVVVISLVLCCSMLANGRAESQMDADADLVEILGDIDDNMLFEDFMDESSGVSPCAVNPCKNEGQCLPIAGDEFICKCREGFFGDTCEKDIDECLTSEPCLNGATCENEPGSYTCTCPPGHSGKNCEKDIDECLSFNPCLNGATCVNSHGSYTCKCPPGYDGQHCGKDVNECVTMKPCQNEGACKNLPGSYQCTCITGYTGKNCEKDVDECLTSNPCQNGATCLNIPGSYRCACQPGFTGTTCGNDINECQTVKPCRNEGACENLPGSYKCSCKTGYTGKNCEKDVDECLTSNPCQNGATCLNVPGSYNCTCQPGFKGETCDTDINECKTLKPCQNGGACENLPGSYKCTCKTGYTGKNCEKDIDECLTTKPCKNGATCLNIPGNYRCTCQLGFSGANCEKDIDECAVKNGGCSHDCTNTVGSYDCSCPDAELALNEDKHTCEAQGVVVKCLQNEMSISIPKQILKGMDREHIRLLDANCRATETPTHFNLKTPLTGCNSTRRYTASAIVYSNKVLEIPLKNKDIITRVREIEIPFSCYYSNYGMATAVGLKPKSRKLVFSEKGIGNFTVFLELFHSDSFTTPYSQGEFPVSLKLRQQIFVQGKVDSIDKRLSIMAEKCFATPTPDENDPKKHDILIDGCAVDDTVKILSSPKGYYHFSLEAFEFIKQPFVFIHCHVIICNASNPQSRCARGCESNGRVRREVGDHKVYSLAQGPITMNYTDEYEQDDGGVTAKQSKTAVEVNMPLVAAMAAMTVLAIFGVAFMALRNKSHGNRYLK
ncbi:uncharacterized protein LOC144659170 [Oculina patagonica]